MRTPGVDAARLGKETSGVSTEGITAQWLDVGGAIVEAGFQAVHAFPMS